MIKVVTNTKGGSVVDIMPEYDEDGNDLRLICRGGPWCRCYDCMENPIRHDELCRCVACVTILGKTYP